jgi:hypothetical protein
VNLADLLELLGYAGDEFVAVCWAPDNGGALNYAIGPSADAVKVAAALGDRTDVWFSVNPTDGPARFNQGGRGKASDTRRLAALYADLDIKPGGCRDKAHAAAIIADLSALIGTRPSAIVHSGHGLQPYWPVDDGHIDDGTYEEISHANAAKLLRRWGQLVALVAGTHNAKVDNVFDLPRILRVPGTVNHKAEPVPVTCRDDIGAPLTVDEIDERLNEAGIYASDADERPTEMLSAPAQWRYAPATCGYVKTMVAGWCGDNPTARHPWLVSQATRLAAAHRNGCLTEQYHNEAVAHLGQQFRTLCSGGQKRPVGQYEIQSALQFGVERTAGMNDTQLANELGRHLHLDELAGKRNVRGNLSEIPKGSTKPRTTESTGSVKPRPTSTGTDNVVPITAAIKGRHLRAISSNDIEDDIPVWAWKYNHKGRIQLGTLALFAGRPGAGKSSAARWFAAQATLGMLEGMWHGRPVNVAYIAPAEESLKFTVKPGLRAAGADLSRIKFVKVFDEENEERLISLLDEQLIIEMCREHDIKVIIVDPVMSTIHGSADVNKNNETRQYVEPWSRIAEAIEGVVVGVVHLRKQNATDIVAAITGSSAFGEVARAVFGFVKDSESDEGDRIMSQAKNSTGSEDLALTYQIVTTEVVTDSGLVGEVGAFMITGESEITADDALNAAANNTGMTAGGTGTEVRAWLEDYLTEQGRAPSKDVKTAALKQGFSERTVKRAAARLGVISESHGFPRVTHWSLPHEQQGEASQ